MAVVSPTPKMQFFMADGTPLVNGKVWTYAAGETTPQDTYTDYTGATPNTNPVILDSRGEANIWLDGLAYKFRLTDANDVDIWTVDYITAPLTAVSPALSGNVTISTNSTLPALKITQVGSGAALIVQDSIDPDATPFIISNDGSVAIGTTTPTSKLTVNGIITTNTIDEYTASSGVTVAGVLIKNNYIGGDYLRIASKIAQNTTSGSIISVLNIPSWATRITVLLNGVSTNSTSPLLVKIGPLGGIVSSGYLSTGARLAAAGTTIGSATTGFVINSTAATDVVSGSLVISLLDSANYIYSSSHTAKADATATLSGGGNVALTGAMTQLVLTTLGGTATFDAGAINVLYE